MPDIELFNRATQLARTRRDWLASASKGGTAHLTRRQCLHRARRAEAHIVDLAIAAEKLARRAGE